MVARNLIFWPVIVLMAMALATYVYLFRTRVRESRAGHVNRERWRLHDDAWPDNVVQISNNLRNQFEMPVLFYGACFMLWALEGVGIVALVTAWLFVLIRIAHAWVHLTSNRMRHRAPVFAASWWVMVFLLLLVAWRLAGRALI